MADLAPAYQALLDQSQVPANAANATPQPTLSPAYQGLLDKATQQAEPKPAVTQPYTGSLWPISVDAQGNTHFDPHTGILGSIIDAFTAPGDVYKGNLDPMSPQAEQRALNLATLMSPVNPAIRAGDYAIPGVLKNLQTKTPQVPTADALKTAADQGYTAARATGATYPGATVATAAQNTIAGLHNDGILPILAPQTHAILGQLATAPEGSGVTVGSLDAARKALNRVGNNFQNPTEQEASRRAIKTIDMVIQAGGSTPSVVGAAPAAATGTANMPGVGGVAALPNQTGVYTTPESRAASLIKNARGDSAAAFRSDRITTAEDAANLRSAAANSGENIGNTLRQRVATLLLNPKTARGYSPDELDALRQIVQGTAKSNTLRRVSKLLGGGGGLGQTMIGALGAVVGGHFGGNFESAGAGAAALPAMGAITRHAYNSAVQRQVENAAQRVRMRSPLYQQMLINAPRVPGSYAMPSRLMRGGLLGQQPQQPASGLMP